MSQIENTFVIICLLVINTNCYNLYGSSDISSAKQVNLVRGHEVVLDIPKYNIKITSTIKDDGRNDVCQHGENCNCDVCSASQRYAAGSEQDGDTNPWTTYELIPVEYNPANVPIHSGYQESSHTMSRAVSNEADDPILGSPRHKHQQTWFYSAPSWTPSDSSNMNILRSSDPRAIQSHSHFVKVNNKHSGNSIFHSHSFIKTKPKLIKPVKHGGLSVHKNMHLHKFRNSDDLENFGRTVSSAARQVDNRFIGSHMFAAPRWRRDTLQRKKRGVLEFVRLVGDHNAKIDVSKTAENVGAATKNVFENEKSPVYHMRNLVGSSQDALMSILSARPRGVLIPSKYRIVSADEAPIVGAINPGLYQQNGELPPAEEFEDEDQDDAEQYADEQPQYQESNVDQCAGRSPVQYDDTFSRIGAILRDSIHRVHKGAEHAADAVHSARQVVATARKYWPKILLPYVGAVEVEKKGKGAEIVGSAQDPQFVGIGRIMDYFGVTGEHPPMEPRLGAPRQVSEEEQLLNNARNSLGTATYRQFMEKMKKELGRYQRLSPKTTDGEQVGSRLLPRLPLRPRPLLPRIPRPIHKPLLLDPNLHRIRTALKLPPKPLPRPVPSPALLRLREALKLPRKPLNPALRIKPPLLPRIRNPLVGAPKPEVKETPALAKLRDALKLPAKPEVKVEKPVSPALAKLRDALKLPAKPEDKVEKPVSPALAKLREAIAQRKAARKSTLVGKTQDITEDKHEDDDNEIEPKPEVPDYIYSDEDTDKSMPEEKTAPPLVGSQAKSIITSPNLDDSDEAEPNKDTAAHETRTSNTDASQSQKESSALERLRAKLQEKKLPADNVDHGDLLGRALEILRSRAQQKAEQKSNSPPVEEVGAAQSITSSPTNSDDTSSPTNNDDDVDNELGAPRDTGDMKFAAVPVPIFTKEMKTPFMGFASKKDLDAYFKNLYCAECKKNREVD